MFNRGHRDRVVFWLWNVDYTSVKCLSSEFKTAKSLNGSWSTQDIKLKNRFVSLYELGV